MQHPPRWLGNRSSATSRRPRLPGSSVSSPSPSSSLLIPPPRPSVPSRRSSIPPRRSCISRRPITVALVVSLAHAGPAFGQHEHGTPADSASGPSPVAGAAGVSLTRMSSGTAWLPDAARLRASHATLGAWAVMLHGAAVLPYDRQSGTRAAEQLGSINWLMAVATRPVGRGAVRVRAMVSAEPWTVTGRGYPELLQVAEPYQGTTVTDRQHPHDLVSELAVLYERPVGTAGLSLYLAPVGEPALGPVAYMHRPSAAYDPMAPLGHHMQDFTHISDGVATLGVFTRRFKVEASVFNGAHPDEVRTDLDPVRLDAYGGRLGFNPPAGLGSHPLVRPIPPAPPLPPRHP